MTPYGRNTSHLRKPRYSQVRSENKNQNRHERHFVHSDNQGAGQIFIDQQQKTPQKENLTSS